MKNGYEIAIQKLKAMEKREYCGSNATAILLAISVIEGNKEKADNYATQLEKIENAMRGDTE